MSFTLVWILLNLRKRKTEVIVSNERRFRKKIQDWYLDNCKNNKLSLKPRPVQPLTPMWPLKSTYYHLENVMRIKGAVSQQNQTCVYRLLTRWFVLFLGKTHTRIENLWGMTWGGVHVFGLRMEYNNQEKQMLTNIIGRNTHPKHETCGTSSWKTTLVQRSCQILGNDELT